MFAGMLRPGTATALEAAFFATDDSDQAALLSDAAETVRRLVEATDSVDEANADQGE